MILVEDLQYGSVSRDWMVVQLRAVFSPSFHNFVFFGKAISSLILDCADFTFSISCEVFDNFISFLAIVPR